MADKKINSEDKIHLSDLEDRLVLDADGALRSELLKDLVDEAYRLKGEQGKGLSPDEFEKNSAMITAVLAAAEVVDQTWHKHHQKSS